MTERICILALNAETIQAKAHKICHEIKTGFKASQHCAAIKAHKISSE
jgi:hypothetical protein